MKLGRVLALLIAFLMGVGLTAYWYSRGRTSPSGIPGEISIISGQHARIMAANGLYEDLSIYETSDGVRVTVIEGDFLKAVSPQQELATLLDGYSVEVIERAPIMNESGEQQVGERIVGHASMFGTDSHALIFQKHGGWYRRVEGRSLKHLLEIEKPLK